MKHQWKNKWGLVSGGTSGIGLATAEKMLSSGASVVILGRSQKRGDKALETLAAYGGSVEFIPVDLSLGEDIAKVGSLLAQRGLKLDFLVNNAGCYEEKRLENVTQEDYQQLFATNVQSTIFLTKALLPLLQTGSAIVNVASDAGIRGNYGCPLYSAAKGAVVAFTRSLALDLAPGIRVNCVCPGDIDTPLVDRQVAQGGYSKADMAEVYPLGRIGRPQEVAAVICSILDEENSFMTGAIVPIDGGLTAKG